ncbi:MAG: hypothetical protein KDB93_00665, partial [Flavobacteriales bacterium]|nr:hypothetical protein [Flavobacteriales bacterium]
LTVREVLASPAAAQDHLFVVDEAEAFEGVVSLADLRNADAGATLATLAVMPQTVGTRDDLRTAAGELARSPGNGPLAVVEDHTVIGLLTLPNVLRAYRKRQEANMEHDASILLHRRRLKVMVQGKQLFRKVLLRK